MGRSHSLATLFALARIQWRAALRKQFRRMRTPGGCVFGIVGGVLILGWLGVMMYAPGRGSDADATVAAVEPDLRLFYAQVFLCGFAFLNLMGAFNAKGLYLPKGEIHKLLSAPIATQDLVRYRLFVDAGKTLLSSVIFIALFWQRLPQPAYGIFGIILALFAITIAGRMIGLAIGNANLWIARLFRGTALGRVGFLLGLLVWMGLVMTFVSDGLSERIFGGGEPLVDRMERIAESPIAIALLMPVRPLAELLLAETVGGFLIWLAASVALLVLVFECTARSAGEIREATLTTSEALAKRLGAMRKGHSGLMVMGRTRKPGARVRRLPRLFGRGRGGTVAWAQCIGITRFSMATTLIGLGVVGMVVMLSLQIHGRAEKQVMVSSLLITVLGTMYLAATMRFDFRSNLSRMESMKSWPLPAGRLFFATVFPQALMVTVLIWIGILVRLGVTSNFHPVLAPCLALVPVVVYAWVALDNAVFLFFPVKFIPGQDGALHHIGRSIMLLALRIILLGAAGLVLGVILFVLSEITEAFGWEEGLVESVAPWIFFIGTLAAGVVFSFAGGFALRRFDVSKAVS